MGNDKIEVLLSGILGKLNDIHKDLQIQRMSKTKMQENALKRQKQIQKKIEKITSTLPPQMKEMVNSMINVSIVKEEDMKNGN